MSTNVESKPNLTRSWNGVVHAMREDGSPKCNAATRGRYPLFRTDREVSCKRCLGTESRQRGQAMAHSLIDGAILYTSWGYDQTNVSFYKVVGRTRCTVDLVPIGSVSTETTSHMSDMVSADPGTVTGEPFRRRVIVDEVSGHQHVKIHASAYGWVWDGSPKHRSWWA